MSLKRLARKKSLALAAAASLTVSGCATVPGAGIAPGTPITPAEAQQGAQYHPQFVAEFGGEVEGIQADYVEQVGVNTAVQSGLGNARNDFNVTLLNSAVPNAFAVPGGYVYITRQLVGLLENEAELAAVLAHEIGHVAARHSARRQTTAQRNQLLGVLGQVLSGVVLGDSALGQLGREISSTVPQLATLSYSREQELEADRLAVQYLKASGYDPRALASSLAKLAAHNQLDTALQGRDAATMPEWASTHPDPGSRVQTALRLAQGAAGVTNRDTFLARVDGLTWGDDPEQGVVEGRSFIHPVYRFAFQAPQGFFIMNGARAVSINGDAGQAQLSTLPYNGNLDTYVRQVFQGIGGNQAQLAPQSLQRTTVNGLPAVVGTARVNTGQQAVDVTVYGYEFSNNQAFHIAAITPAGRAGVFAPLFNSMQRISAAQAAQVISRRIDVVTAGPRDSVESLASRMAYTNAQVERFRVLNGLAPSDRIVPGQKYKIVVRSSR